MLDGVRLVGALLLIYLAVSSWRTSRAPQAPSPTVPQRALRKVYAMATLTNIANPKVVLFYLAFVPQFLTTGASSWPITIQLLTLGTLFIAIGLLIDAPIGALAGTFSNWLLRHGAFRRWLDRVAAAIFGGLAVRLALDLR